MQEKVKQQGIFDLSKEYEDFRSRHPLFLERFPNVVTARKEADEVQEEHFKLPGLAEQIKRCEQVFVEMHS